MCLQGQGASTAEMAVVVQDGDEDANLEEEEEAKRLQREAAQRLRPEDYGIADLGIDAQDDNEQEGLDDEVCTFVYLAAPLFGRMGLDGHALQRMQRFFCWKVHQPVIVQPLCNQALFAQQRRAIHSGALVERSSLFPCQALFFLPAFCAFGSLQGSHSRLQAGTALLSLCPAQ